MYLLDSNAWIAFLRGTSASLLAELKRRPSTDIFLCPVVLAELWYGACRSAAAKRAANESLVRQLQASYRSAPLDDAAAVEAGALRADLAATGQIIGPYDLLIAAIVRTNQLTLVTHNTKEFSRIKGLQIEDWQT
jgi:tRNA(fMet)-specific endonuclease VapC